MTERAGTFWSAVCSVSLSLLFPTAQADGSAGRLGSLSLGLQRDQLLGKVQRKEGVRVRRQIMGCGPWLFRGAPRVGTSWGGEGECRGRRGSLNTSVRVCLSPTRLPLHVAPGDGSNGSTGDQTPVCRRSRSLLPSLPWGKGSLKDGRECNRV